MPKTFFLFFSFSVSPFIFAPQPKKSFLLPPLLPESSSSLVRSSSHENHLIKILVRWREKKVFPLSPGGKGKEKLGKPLNFRNISIFPLPSRRLLPRNKRGGGGRKSFAWKLDSSSKHFPALSRKNIHHFFKHFYLVCESNITLRDQFCCCPDLSMSVVRRMGGGTVVHTACRGGVRGETLLFFLFPTTICAK